MSARILVTGGAGFLGSHLCDRFIGEGHEVVCIDNLITGNRDNIAHLFGDPKFKFDWAPDGNALYGHKFPFAAALCAVSDIQGHTTPAFDTAVALTATAYGANVMKQEEIDFSTYDDDLAGDDLVCILFGRDDTAIADESVSAAYLLGGIFEYTVS